MTIGQIFQCDDAKAALEKTLPKVAQKFQYYSNHLGDKDYFLGYPTIFDFELAYLYLFLRHLYVLSLKMDHPMDKHENLIAHHKRVYKLEAIKKHNKTSKHKHIIPPSYFDWFKTEIEQAE